MKALVYSKDDCPHCDRALEILESKGVKVDVVKVIKDISPERFKGEIFRKANRVVSTVPQIFLDDKYIGGCDDLIEHYENESLSDEFSDFEL